MLAVDGESLMNVFVVVCRGRTGRLSSLLGCKYIVLRAQYTVLSFDSKHISCLHIKGGATFSRDDESR